MKRMIFCAVHKSGSIAFQFAKAVPFNPSRIEAAQKVKEPYASDQGWKIRVRAIGIRG
jgi:hypothetical protein